jgi:UDP-glucose 6-dehydrogenase
LNINKNIQSVTIINKFGRALEKAYRPNHEKQFSDDMDKMLYMQCVLQVSLGTDFDEQFGAINYHISERANLTMLTFPFSQDVILVIANKKTSPISLARKISSLILDHKSRIVIDNPLWA